MIYNNILETIGKTPVVKIQKLFGDNSNVYIKLEKSNPGGSLKDRIALQMVEDAEKAGKLSEDSVIIEPTSGNTGVGLSMVAAVKGYKLILVMPESMSIERRKLMASYGAEFVLTPKEGGMKAAIEKAKELTEENPKAWMPSQFDNPSNIKAHLENTAQELLEDFPNGIDYLITGVGTGGHISAISKVLKEKFPKLKVFAVEPTDSPVISGGEPGGHAIQGIGAGFIPENLKTDLLDGAIQISKEEAFDFTRKAAKQEGILGGISSGATLAAIAQKLPEIGDKVVVGLNYDTGERYLSTEGLF
ncbi:cysteine synthase A [Weeksellaceae bacterium KMM 9713]|uniref:cysteine synthase n=1 Tax=Profundicola chukchiensis TaxID=2961959 RepID=A0A9X4RVG2_9FLAO|nr:cysteine synthase A [Profundicola chukchiensis]MDG4946636.1 cysteine synthase A [Profundicola chukchiensis]